MKYEQWTLKPAPAPAEVAEAVRAGLPPLCAAVLCARGFTRPEEAARFLSYGEERFHDPFLMKDMDRAAARITAALDQNEIIAVYGDYDVDGITATALLSQFLEERGGAVVSYIPDRADEGYGLNRSAIDRLKRQGVSLIVTVDCGITAGAEVDYARSLGLDVIITDHHHCKTDLPEAAAVVDPRRPDCSYPFKELCGVGLALKLAMALAPEGERDRVLRRYGELAAIGTVADVMSLTDENRSLVHLGLELLRRTRRPGLRALLREAGCGNVPLTTVNVGYGLAPRINAAGRMGRTNLALELLRTDIPAHGEDLAQTLCQMNRERQAIEQAIDQECEAYLEQHPEETAPAIVLAGEGWHQGVVGIVASRLAEKYACPAVMISLEDGIGKGSCRSFGGFHLFRALEKCAPLLEEFGGHHLAAGFTIREENIPAFKAALLEQVTEYTGGRPMTSEIDVDLEIEHCSLLDLRQAEALSALEPFGAGNPRPVFLLRSAAVVSCCDVGGGRHLKMKLRRDGVVLDAIFFSANAAACGVSAGDHLDLIFTLQINEFRGERAVQLQLCDLRPAPTRAQLERELYARLREGEALSRWEAGLLLPRRQDFARLWRLLEQLCAAGPVPVGPALIRQAAKDPSGRCCYGRVLVCLHVMDDRGLIRWERTGGQTTVAICRPEQKVDLEQSQLMRRLRAILE